jgi:hypothetical protein
VVGPDLTKFFSDSSQLGLEVDPNFVFIVYLLQASILLSKHISIIFITSRSFYLQTVAPRRGKMQQDGTRCSILSILPPAY